MVGHLFSLKYQDFEVRTSKKVSISILARLRFAQQQADVEELMASYREEEAFSLLGVMEKLQSGKRSVVHHHSTC